MSSAASLPTVLLRPGEADRVLAGHPWIYQGSVLRLSGPVSDGAVVQVKDHRRRHLGIGFYNSKSKINVRLLDFERREIDGKFFEDRIQRAFDLRRNELPGATSYRVVNAESDFLSGLIIDRYGAAFVVQTSSLGMDQRKGLILDALKKLFSPAAIVERNEAASRRFEGLPEANGLLEGSPEAVRALLIEINGLKFQVDLLEGHKTGFYLDQQTNYQRVSQRARGRVLDCFSFQGGFALHAARNGAAQVLGIDQSAEATEAAQRNAALNGLSERCSFECANVFDWLKQATTAPPHEKIIPQFDLIILDPPSFTRNRAAVADALRGYKEIHLRAFKLLKPGGTLATFCCSHHVDAALFQEVILEAAFDARRILRRVESYAQSPDHPILPTVPETEYLKGFAFELAR